MAQATIGPKGYKAFRERLEGRMGHEDAEWVMGVMCEIFKFDPGARRYSSKTGASAGVASEEEGREGGGGSGGR